MIRQSLHAGSIPSYIICGTKFKMEMCRALYSNRRGKSTTKITYKAFSFLPQSLSGFAMLFFNLPFNVLS